MKQKISFIQLGLVSVALFAISLIFGAADTFAAERVWTGDGSDNNLATAANWQGGVAPDNGDSIIIPLEVVMSLCEDNVVLDNDLDSSSVTLVGVAITGLRPDGCWDYGVELTGNNLVLSGDITKDSLQGFVLDTDIHAAASISVDRIQSRGSVVAGSNDITLRQSTFDGGISGSGQLTLSGFSSGGAGGGCSYGNATPSPFRGDGSGFTGSIVVADNGSIGITSRSNDVARHASSITQSGGYIVFRLDSGQNMSFDGSITLNGRVSVSQNLADDSCNQPVSNGTLTISNATVSGPTEFFLSYANAELTGSSTGAQHVTVVPGISRAYYLRLSSGAVLRSKLRTTVVNASNKSQYCYESSWGLSILANNKYIWNVSCPELSQTEGSSTSAVRGILAGTGRVGAIVIANGGVIAPGESPGTINTGNLTFEEGGIYEFEVTGTGSDQYDRINVTGTVTLGNGTLRVVPLNNFQPRAGQSFIIISNDGSDAVNGTFAGLPEGATVSVGGTAMFTISYRGGDGNDVVLTALPSGSDTGAKQDASHNTLFMAVGAALTASLVVVRKLKAARKS